MAKSSLRDAEAKVSQSAKRLFTTNDCLTPEHLAVWKPFENIVIAVHKISNTDAASPKDE
jgi:hypothetical protein